ncbi:MAG TPA: phosphopantothenoylcysteine decarboxylase, partial [Desulfuromonadales bacterium]|nr:phosphopantothenoylcysteine decarboxylase [Desulfuromonadales bacterium]
FRPGVRDERKIKKGEEEQSTLSLQRNPDILAELGKLKGRRILVGFAAETDDLTVNAEKKLKAKNLDLIVANDILQPESGFDSDTNAVQLLYRGGAVEELPLMTKEELAATLMERIVRMLEKAN